MTTTVESLTAPDLGDPKYYFNRELSWLEFNRRVLHEALDARTPLLERLKFAAIFSSNLDEFFMVRVASLQRQLTLHPDHQTIDGRTPQQQLDDISERLHPMVAQLQALLETELRPQLAAAGVYVRRDDELNAAQRDYLQQYFETQVFPLLTPLAFDPTHPFPIMANLSLNFAVVSKDPDTGAIGFARVKVPANLPRFVPLPLELSTESDRPRIWEGIAIEQVIAQHLDRLFPGMVIQEHHLFRLTRDMDLSIEEAEDEDLLQAIAQELPRRRFGGCIVRFEYAPTMSELVKQTLIQGMDVDANDLYETQGWMGMRDLMTFMSLPLPHLKDQPYTPVVPRPIQTMQDLAGRTGVEADIFGLLRQQDVLVHHPYESFADSVELFITQAANDPQVQAIKMTLYRTSNDSPIITALVKAAQAEKQVVALVELKARFDEASNITWAQTLENAGVHVIYGVAGLKTHTKVTLVVRQEGDTIRRYVHIGTGNYNSKTAKLYTDLGLLTCRDELGADLTDLFNYLTGHSKQKSFRQLLVAPETLRSGMEALIRREIQHCQNGGAGRIIAKMNALIDPGIIQTLYAASQAGVQIDLIVRGMCCLRPGIRGVSENIRVMSIVGRFLEHSRIFYFHNNGQAEVYLGSADWMERNLDRRVEAVTPVAAPDCANRLKDILDILLRDNRQAWDLQADGSYIQRQPADDAAELSAHNVLMAQAVEQS